MSDPLFVQNINLLGLGQLINARAHNVTTAEMNAMANTLSTSNTGVFVFNTDDGRNYIWNGTQFTSIGSGGDPVEAVELVMISPNGRRWKLTIDDCGSLLTTRLA